MPWLFYDNFAQRVLICDCVTQTVALYIDEAWAVASVKSRSRAIGCYDDHVALEFNRRLDSAADEVTVEFQSDWKSLNPNLVASRLREILR